MLGASAGEDDLSIEEIGGGGVAFAEFAGEDLERERVEEFALDDALERAGAIDGVVTFAGEVDFGG